MNKNIIFCGTPEFAGASLISLFQNQKKLQYKISGVITIPDKISGRGQKKTQSFIKKKSIELGLNVFQPTKLNDTYFIRKIKELEPDLIIVVAFKKLPKELYNIPKFGTINLHASLLPNFRGAAPINWVIIKGEKITGLTTFFINEKIDHGDIIMQKKIHIDENWHASDLYNELMKYSDEIIKNTIRKVFNRNNKLIKQTELTNNSQYYARKINKSDFYISQKFLNNQTIKNIYNYFRGMSPPGVKVKLIIENYENEIIEKRIIIIKVESLIMHEKTKTDISKSIQIDRVNNNIIMTDHNAQFFIKKIKLNNGKELNDKDFINGFLNNKKNICNIKIIEDKEKAHF